MQVSDCIRRWDVMEHDGNESPHIMFYCDVSAEKAKEL